MPTIRERAGRFQAIVRVKQAGVLIHNEARTFDTERLARDWGQRVEREIARVGVQARVRATCSLADLIDKYRVAREEIKPLGRSMHGDLDLLHRTLGHHRLDALTAQTLSQFARARRSEGAGPATVLHNLAILRSVLGAARPMFGIQADTAEVTAAIQGLSLTGHVARSNKRDRRPTQAELSALIAEFERIAAYPQTKLPMALIIQLAVALPRRISELCAARWEGLSGSVLTLVDTKHPRVPRTERIPVPAEALSIIRALPRIDERILPYKSESVSAAFDRACQRICIDNLHLHDLRHEGICRLFEQGLNIPEVSMISGHLSWTTLKRYTHLTPQHVLERLNARTQGIPEGGAQPAQPGQGA